MHRFLPLLVLVTGCKAVDAPERLEELVVFGFVHHLDDEAFPRAAAEGIDALRVEHAAALIDGLRVDDLGQEDLDEAGVETTVQKGIVGVAATSEYASSLDQIAVAWTWPDMSEVLQSTLDYRIDHRDGDRDCFVAQDCDQYAIDAWRVTDAGLFGDATSEFRREFRWVPSDAGTVLAVRDLVPEKVEMSGGVVAIHQQFAYTLWFPAGSGTQRFDAFWVDAEVIGLDVPDTFAIDLAVSSLGKAAEDVDRFVAERL
jgi:hypothetical protein